MTQKQIKGWHQRIRCELEKYEKQTFQSKIKRLLKEENAYCDAMKKNQIALKQLQIKHAEKMQHIQEDQNQKTANRTKSMRKRLTKPTLRNIKVLKKSEKNRVNLLRVGIRLRKKILKKRKLLSRTGYSKLINANTPTAQTPQAKLAYPPHLTSNNLLLKYSFLSANDFVYNENSWLKTPANEEYKENQASLDFDNVFSSSKPFLCKTPSKLQKS